MEPRVGISLYLSGDKADLREITEQLEIKPTYAKLKEEWPQGTIDAGLATNIWAYRGGKEKSRAISQQFDKIQQLFLPKINIIKKLCKKYSLEVNVEIIVWMEAGDGPELVLSRENIAFLSSIDAEMGFDLYVD